MYSEILGLKMNEKIRQIALQAGGAGIAVKDFIDTEKFAELIVRECAQVASEYDGAHYVGTAIEKHFGVE